jgi:GNAT superfamily N-acetyltransferase
LIRLSPATPDHVTALAVLTAEKDRFYGATGLEPLAVREAQITTALFGAVPHARVLLAWDDDRIVGFASYVFLWPAAGLTSSLYLKELFVSGPSRRGGVGAELMRALFRIAAEQGCSRVEWTADQDNPGALAFYERLGVAPLSSKVFYRIRQDDLKRLAGS